MASLTIRNLNDDIKSQLRQQAAAHGHSMEQEARLILSAAVSQPASNESFVQRLQNRFKGLDTSVLQQPERTEVPPALDLSSVEDR